MMILASSRKVLLELQGSYIVRDDTHHTSSLLARGSTIVSGGRTSQSSPKLDADTTTHTHGQH